MPCTATRRENAMLVQLGRDSTHTGEPLSPQVIHDGPKVRRTILCVRRDGSNRLRIGDRLPLSARAPLGLPNFTPRAFAAARAALVRSLISPASNSATEAICVSRKRPIAPGGTWGRSQNTRSTSLATSERKRSTLRVSRSSLAKTTVAPRAFAWASALTSLGLSLRLPLSASTYSAASVHRPPFR